MQEDRVGTGGGILSGVVGKCTESSTEGEAFFSIITECGNRCFTTNIMGAGNMVNTMLLLYADIWKETSGHGIRM